MDRIHPVDAETGSAPPPPHGAYYSVKDQAMPVPATYRDRKRERNPCFCFLMWLCTIVSICFVLMGIAILVFWLVVRPREISYDVESVHINGLSPDEISPSSTVNTNTSFELLAFNRNKHIGVYYDEIHVMVEVDGTDMGDKFLTPFYQGHDNITFIGGEVVSTGVSLSSDVTDAIRGNADFVPISVNVDMKTRLKVGSWKLGKNTVKVRCDFDFYVPTQYAAYRNCRVKRN